MTTGTWSAIAAERPAEEWTAALIEAVESERLDPAQVARGLLAVWPDRVSLRPLQERSIEAWTALHAALRGVFAVDGRLREAARPARPLRLYRGARVGAEHGMSWSPFRMVAGDFRRKVARGEVWTAVVPPDRMFCAYAGQSGGAVFWEIVADVEGLEVEPYRGPTGRETALEDFRALKAAR